MTERETNNGEKEKASEAENKKEKTSQNICWNWFFWLGRREGERERKKEYFDTNKTNFFTLKV